MNPPVPWKPKPWQLDAVRFLVANSHGGLFYDAGLGKTSSCLAAISVLKKKGFVTRTLVVAPIRTLYTVWPIEVKKWAEFTGLRVINLHDEPERLFEDADIYLINPERVDRLFAGKTPSWDHLIVDESTMFKNHSAKRFKALKDVLHRFSRRWILTGTPTPNGLTDIWAQIFLVDGGKALGRYITHFRRAFCVPDERNLYQWHVTPDGADEIKRRVAPLVLRRAVGDGGVDMPALLKNTLLVTLPRDARRTYDQMEREFCTTVEKEGITSMNAAIAGMRCRQIASGAIYNETGDVLGVHPAKVQALTELLTTLEGLGKPALIFYEFKHEAERVQAAFPGTPNLSDTSDFLDLIQRFNRGEVPRMLAHPASAGYGNNLQERCSDVVFFTPTWDLNGYEQGIARVWRQGQTRGVTVHHVVAQGTLDESVMTVLGEKSKTQQDLLEAVRRHGNEVVDA